jgi:D-serine deaminase-like pyridoxal phosphate-dependent protein
MRGDANRWRPHVKTAKLASVMQRLVARGVKNLKCSTTLELSTACRVGAADVLVAYPLVGANAKRTRDLAGTFPAVRVSVLVENMRQVREWTGSAVQLFIDVNPGMNRTGIEQARIEEITQLARFIQGEGLVFAGLHYYDGHLGKIDAAPRNAMALRGYDRLVEMVAVLQGAGVSVPEVITSGTPAFLSALSYPGFQDGSFVHRVSPGTVVYGDCTSLSQLPGDMGYRPAALVVSTVVSHPTARRITCDAGHKAVSADEGIPTCVVCGHPEMQPQKPSEEHLPIDIDWDSEPPAVGSHLYLVPRHVCPTVNNFDTALLVVNGKVESVVAVTARGHEGPLIGQ